MSNSRLARFTMGAFEVRPAEGRLVGPQGELRVEPKAMDVLVTLAERVGEVVSKQELIASVWEGAFVSDEVLTNAIWQLRRALGDDARSPSYIATIPRRGYRLLIPVSAVDRHDAETATVRGHKSARRGIAVLPFVDMSAGGDHEYLCDGIAEEIMGALSRLEGLKVAARTSSFAFKGTHSDVREIGKTLGVASVLEGSVRSSGDRLRITVQLADAEEGCQVWAERFDRPARDIFAIQDAIALAVTERLQVRLRGGERRQLLRRHTQDLEAYELYLRGRHLFYRRRRQDFPTALECLHRAIERDPAYVAAHLALADIHVVLGVWGFAPPPETFGAAEAAGRRALEIDPECGESHLTLALVFHLHRRELQRAERHFVRAFELGVREPLARVWHAVYHLMAGDPRAAVLAVRRGIDSDPLSPIVKVAAAAVYVGIEDVERALELLEAARRLDPAMPVLEHWLGWCYAAGQRDREAIVPLERAATAGLSLSAGLLGLVLARLGRRSEAQEQLRALEAAARGGYVPYFSRAVLLAGLGEIEESFDLIAKASREGEPALALSLTAGMLSGLLPDEWIERARGRLRSTRHDRSVQSAPGDS